MLQDIDNTLMKKAIEQVLHMAENENEAVSRKVMDTCDGSVVKTVNVLRIAMNVAENENEAVSHKV